MTEQDLAELRVYFQSIEIPKTLKFNDATFMNDVTKAINVDFQILDKFGYTGTFAASYYRLQKIKDMIEKGEGY